MSYLFLRQPNNSMKSQFPSGQPSQEKHKTKDNELM
jgi:hypothetical protein